MERAGPAELAAEGGAGVSAPKAIDTMDKIAVVTALRDREDIDVLAGISLRARRTAKRMQCRRKGSTSAETPVTAPGGASSENGSRRPFGPTREEYGSYQRHESGEEVGRRGSVERLNRGRQRRRRATGGANAALAFRVLAQGVPAAFAIARRRGAQRGHRRGLLRSAWVRVVAVVVAGRRVAGMSVSRPIRMVVHLRRAVRQRAAMPHRRRSHGLKWQCRDENPHQGAAKPGRHGQSLRDESLNARRPEPAPAP